MIMPTMEILHLCRGTWCWLQWEMEPTKGVTGVLHPAIPSSLWNSEFLPGDHPVCQPSFPPENKQCWWHLWLCSDKRTSQSLVYPEFHKLSFFPACFGQAAKDGEKDTGICSVGSPTDQQPEGRQETGIQLVNSTSWKPNPQRIRREMNSWSWTQAGLGSVAC